MDHEKIKEELKAAQNLLLNIGIRMNGFEMKSIQVRRKNEINIPSRFILCCKDSFPLWSSGCKFGNHLGKSSFHIKSEIIMNKLCK